jgi:hypothetical protein
MVRRKPRPKAPRAQVSVKPVKRGRGVNRRPAFDGAPKTDATRSANSSDAFFGTKDSCREGPLSEAIGRPGHSPIWPSFSFTGFFPICVCWRSGA